MSAFDRAAALARLATEDLDVLVVGGGITGAGVALDAASRTRAVLADAHAASSAAGRVPSLLAGGLGWSDDQTAQDARRFRSRARADLERAGVPAPAERGL